MKFPYLNTFVGKFLIQLEYHDDNITMVSFTNID